MEEHHDRHSAIPRWAQPFVAAAVGTGAMRGYPDGSFGGQRTATRAEAVTLLHRLKELAGRQLTVTSVYLPENDGRESIWDGVAVFEVDPVVPGLNLPRAKARGF